MTTLDQFLEDESTIQAGTLAAYSFGIDYFAEHEPLTIPLVEQLPDPYREDNHLNSGAMGHVYQTSSNTAAKVTVLAPLPEDAGYELSSRLEFRYIGSGLFKLNGKFFIPKNKTVVQQLQRCYAKALLMKEMQGAPHIVQFQDHKFEYRSGHLCSTIEMEYVPGKNLHQLVQEGLHERDAAKAVLDTIDALVSIGKKGIIHRDIKPLNVMYTPSDTLGQGTATLVDFGLAMKQKGFQYRSDIPDDVQSLLLEDLMTPGMIMGTKGYFSPEQVQGKELTLKTDIFSLGLLAVEVFTGQRAFPEEYPDDSQKDLLHCMLKVSNFNKDTRQGLLARLHQRYLPHNLVKAVECTLDPKPDRRNMLPLRQEALNLVQIN